MYFEYRNCVIALYILDLTYIWTILNLIMGMYVSERGNDVRNSIQGFA